MAIGPQSRRRANGWGTIRGVLGCFAALLLYGGIGGALILFAGRTAPASGQAPDPWRILAVRVSFSEEHPDDRTTSGGGTFDLRPFSEVREGYRFPFDTPPHDRAYFEAHLQALANYYREVSGGRIEIEYEVYPRDPNGSYILSRPLKAYGNGRTRREIDDRITRLFRDGLAAADSVEGEGLDFSGFRAFAVFHAGLGGESGQALNDIPSAFIGPGDLHRYVGGPIPVDNGARAVTGGMLLPEAISTDGRGGLNGTLVRFFANQLGLPGLSDFENDLPAVGDWSPMDTGANNLSSAARLGLQGLQDDPADTVLVGFIPSRMLAWSRIRLGWLKPHIVTHNDTVRIVAPHVAADLPQAVAVPISADEYFLLENRISRLSLNGRVPQIEFSRGSEGGVWLSVDDYDAFIPGSGLLVWHVDDAVIRSSDADTPINSNPRYRIGTAQYRRGISLEEADGADDIGNVSSSRVIQDGIISFGDIEGGPADPFYAGGNTRFGPETLPATTSNLGYPTGIAIEALSPPGDTMVVSVTFSRQRDAWPVIGPSPDGLQVPRAVDLDGDGRSEIIRSQRPEISAEASAWTIEGGLHGGFHFSASTPPAVGDLITDGSSAGRMEFISGHGGIPSLWSDGRLAPAGADGASRNAVISAPPTIARFPEDAATDIWGWSDGKVEWGTVAGGGGGGAVDPGAGPIAGLAVGNIDADPSKELVALTETGRIFLVEGPGRFRELAALEGSPVGGPVLADLDRDGDDEVALVTADGAVSILDADGLAVRGRPVPGGAGSPPVLGDLDGDGFVEVLFGGVGRLWGVRFNGVLQTGTPLSFPLKDEAGPIEASPVLADLDGDGALEILAGSQGGLIYGLRANGDPLPGFPLSAVGPIRTSPLLDDLDGDGTLELVAFTEDGAIHLWHLEEIDPALTGSRVIWGQLGGGPGNAGRLLKAPEAPPPEPSAALLPVGRTYCYPNPIRGTSAHLRFFLGGEAHIRVVILNAIGEVVGRLSRDSPVPRTDNEILWDTAGYASGLYICRIEATAEGRSEVRFVKAAVIR